MKVGRIDWKIVAVLLSLVYLATRLLNLTIMPIFVDEAIYTRWSQIIASDPTNNLFIPLSDGKQPLYMWIAAFFSKILSDPLVATRLVSVLAGLLGMWGIYLLGKEIFNKRIGIISAVLFIFCPFLFFYNRLAVVDGLLTTFFVFTVLFIYRLTKKPTLLNAILLGLLLGGGMLTKTTAALSAIWIPAVLLIFDWQKKNNLKRLLKLAGLFLVSGVIAFALYRILKISPLYYLIGQRTPDFIFSPKEVLQHPLDPFAFRIGDVAGWLLEYLTLPVFLLSWVGFIFMVVKNWRVGIFVGAFFFGPLLVEMQIAKGFTPRYFIFVAPLALTFAAYILGQFLENYQSWKVGVIAALLVPAILFEFLLVSNPEKAPIPQKEKTGYLEEWSAGYGIKEIADYIKMQETRNNLPITIGTEGTEGYGTLPDGLEVYLRDTKNVTVVGMGQRADIITIPKDLISDSKIHPAYLVVNSNRLYDKENKVLHLVASYPKANGGNPLQLYEIKSSN